MTMPYRIETSRLVLRCYQPSDAPLLKAAIDAPPLRLYDASGAVWAPRSA